MGSRKSFEALEKCQQSGNLIIMKLSKFTLISVSFYVAHTVSKSAAFSDGTGGGIFTLLAYGAPSARPTYSI